MKQRSKQADWSGVFARVLVMGGLAWWLSLNVVPQGLQQARLAYVRAVHAGAPAQAADSLERAAAYQPWREDLVIAVARFRLQAGDLAGLADSLQHPQVLAALTGEDWLRLGEAHLASGDSELAVLAWKQGLQVGDAAVELYDHLHSLYLSLGNYTAAVAALRPTLVLRPDEPGRAFQLGLYLSALQPNEALVYLELAKQDVSQQSEADALLRTIRTAALAGEPAYTYLQAGRQLASLGRWALAGEAFRQSVLARPDYAEAWALLGEARQQVGGDSAQALADLQQALQRKPDSALANSLLGLYWERQGDVDQMVACLTAAAKAEPENAAWQAELGRALALTGDLAAAQEHYQMAVRLAPQQARYLRLLAEFSLRYNVNVEEVGLPAARQAVALQPGDASALDVLGQGYLSLGNLSLAERFLRQAAAIQPTYAPAWLHLGALHLFRGEREAGHLLLLRAMQLAAPGTATADQVHRLMAHFFP